MSSFYTRDGDDGYTGLLGEGRVAKSDARMELLGTLDEANAALGIARAWSLTEQSKAVLLQVQRDLYLIMTEAAAAPENASRFTRIDAQHVAWLENRIETLNRQITMPEEFIIPGDTPAEAGLDLARTVVRRAERRMMALVQLGQVQNDHLLVYLNRLSSLCFVLELVENQHAGKSTPTLAKG
jgi:cob(I)alamin adenosyltransferase